MRILLTNDDGINAPGFFCLGKALEEFAELFVVAPDTERSGTSKSITFQHPLRVKEREVPFRCERSLMVNGTPADCSKLALNSLLGFRPDLVISGVNSGPNLGVDIHYSGTVAGAFEGAQLGIPAMAVSLVIGRNEKPLWDECSIILLKLFKILLQNFEKLKNTFLNINIPNREASEIGQIKFLAQGDGHYEDCYMEMTDPRGNPCYWLQGNLRLRENLEKMDQSVRGNNFICITPLHIDHTHYPQLESFSNDPAFKI
ncbi:5'/3'-nucleotidase SurE [Candidatus Riflebacteria bacterium]